MQRSVPSWVEGGLLLGVHVAPDVEQASASWLYTTLDRSGASWTPMSLSDLVAPPSCGLVCGVVAMERLATVDPVSEVTLPLVVVTHGVIGNIRHIVHWDCAGLALFGETEYLVQLLRTVSGPVPNELLAAAREFRDLPILAAALRALANHQARGRTPGAPSPGSALRTIGALARQVGCSPSYLSRLARANGIDLALLVDTCLVSSAHTLKGLGRTDSWEKVAWRLGYSSPSSLTELFKRTTRATPSACGRMSSSSFRALLRSLVRESLNRPA